MLVCAIERGAGESDQVVDLLTRNNEWRGRDHNRADRPHHEAAFHREIATHCADGGGVVEAEIGGLVRDQFQSSEETAGAGFSDEWVIAEGGPAFREIRASVVGDARDDTLALENLEVGKGCGARCGMSGVGVAVIELATFFDPLNDTVGDDQSRDREIAGRQALGDRDDVGFNAISLTARTTPQAGQSRKWTSSETRRNIAARRQMRWISGQ